MLKEARKEANLTQEQLAEKAGTKKSYISKFGNAKGNIQLSTLIRILKKKDWENELDLLSYNHERFCKEKLRSRHPNITDEWMRFRLRRKPGDPCKVRHK